jgi:hypothetical protein
MTSTRTRLLAAALAAALAFIPALDASARGGFRGGGFRSSGAMRSIGGSRSFSGLKSTGAARSLGWGSATKPAATGTAASPFASTRRSISGSRSSVSSQRGLYDSAKKNGTLFSSKAEASQAFRSKYAKDYGSTFASEPSARPSYIPGSTSVGGQNVNIVYNQGLGGYGYLHPTLGTWILFDALADAATADALMSNRGYYWGGAPAYLSHGPSYLGLAFFILALIIVASIVSKAVSAARAAAMRDDRRGRY